MADDDLIAAVAQAIRSEVAHPLGSMRILPVSEEDVALSVLNALDEAGYDVVKRNPDP